jgi:hypothetical protein
MDRDGVVQYLATDHLGSTSLVPDGQGGKVTESRHYPYGEERWSSGTQTTIVSPGSCTIPLPGFLDRALDFQSTGDAAPPE